MTLARLAAGPDVARIGPNAIVRTIEALRERAGDATTREILARAGIARFFDEPPQAMVFEHDVSRLFGALCERLEAGEADACMRAAGRKTADYLIANRIPRRAAQLLRLLPPGVSSRMLLGSIAEHAWTFAGSGTVRLPRGRGRPVRFSIEDCPICREIQRDSSACAYVAASLERLFRRLVAQRTTVVEIACEAQGAAGCVFEIRY